MAKFVTYPYGLFHQISSPLLVCVSSYLLRVRVLSSSVRVSWGPAPLARMPKKKKPPEQVPCMSHLFCDWWFFQTNRHLAKFAF